MSKYALTGRFAVILLALALSTAIASAQSKIVISIAGEAFDGPPTFEVTVGGKPIGSATLKNAIETETQGRLFSNARPQSFLEEFTFSVPDDAFATDAEISIALINDKYEDAETGYDRNLFIDYIAVNGLEVTSADLQLTMAGEPYALDYQAGLLPIYESNHRAVATPPATGWPLPGTAASEQGDISVLPAVAAGRMLVPAAPLSQAWLGN